MNGTLCQVSQPNSDLVRGKDFEAFCEWCVEKTSCHIMFLPISAPGLALCLASGTRIDCTPKLSLS